MKYIRYYFWNVIIAYCVFLPILYIGTILQAMWFAIWDNDNEIAEALRGQRRVNAGYRRRHNMKGLCDPIDTGLE